MSHLVAHARRVWSTVPLPFRLAAIGALIAAVTIAANSPGPEQYPFRW